MISISDYFGDWKKVIDYKRLSNLINTLDPLYANTSICPDKNLVFKPFNLCPYSELKVVMIGDTPYNESDIGNGLLFGNTTNTGQLTPILERIKESVINYHLPHYAIDFDHTLTDWANQGCLLLNFSLTVETGSKSNHIDLWKPFITGLIQRLSEDNTGIIYVLFGDNAQSLIPHIGKFNYILPSKHPKDVLNDLGEYRFDIFNEINKILKNNYNSTIDWYSEL